MVGIWEYPDLAELENFISSLTLQAAQEVSEQPRTEASYVADLSLSRVIVINDWGDGTAIQGDHPLEVVLFFDFTGPDEAFDDVSSAVTEQMADIIQGGRVVVPQDLIDGTSNITFTSANANNFDDVLLNMATSGMNMIYDLTDQQAIDLKVGSPPEEYPRIPLAELLGEDEEETVDEIEDEESVVEPSDVDSAIDIEDVSSLPEVTLFDEEPEDVGPEFPEVHESVRPFAVSPDTLEIPAGKETKEIDVREPYDFEVEMALPGINTSTATSAATREEIAREAGAGTLGDNEPVGTFPRTGLYIRNYLKFRGPAYSYEIYKNLVFYSAYISTLHDINVKAGKYSAFREYMYVLEQIGERRNLHLIDALSQPEAAAEELETVPDHPSIEGAKAPWLERRQYYRLIEENDNHDAWENAYDYLHEDIDESL